MSAVYLETSSLLRWLLGEPAADETRRRIDDAPTVVTSTLTLAEASRALIRAEREGLVNEGDGRRLRGTLERAQAGWLRMGVTEAVLERASRPFPVEPVRTLDAIHLATALEFAAVFPELRVLTGDRRIQDNAETLGLA